MRYTDGEVDGYQGPVRSMYVCGLMLKCIYILIYWKTRFHMVSCLVYHVDEVHSMSVVIADFEG